MIQASKSHEVGVDLSHILQDWDVESLYNRQKFRDREICSIRSVRPIGHLWFPHINASTHLVVHRNDFRQYSCASFNQQFQFYKGFVSFPEVDSDSNSTSSDWS
jgi:hypothetical protein